MRLDELSGDTDALARVKPEGGMPLWAVRRAGGWYALPVTLTELCAAGVSAARGVCDAAADVVAGRLDPARHRLLAPVDATQEVWAAGVTYERSRTARIEESGARDLYTFVYDSPRPELFWKATGRRVVGAGDWIGVRADARWSVPEPELVVVFDAAGDVLGFTAGDDVSSRDIEGANALYLPQAKVYDRSCAVGPAIVPAWSLGSEPEFEIALEIRRGDATVYTDRTSTSRLHRHWEDLGRWLRAGLTFEDGVLLMTGTGIVPGDDLSLCEGDGVQVRIDGIGTLINDVRTVGVAVDAGATSAPPTARS